jgi:uncharacterized integral membrane protein
MADEQRDRGPVDEGNGGPVTPVAQPPQGGAHGTGSNGSNGSDTAALVKPDPVSPVPVAPGAGKLGLDKPGSNRPGSTGAAPDVRLTGGRISGVWVALTLSAVVLIFLLIFIVQNNVDVPIRFLGMAGTLPLGVALLFAAALGVLLVAIPGYGRILQLRRALRKRGAR